MVEKNHGMQDMEQHGLLRRHRSAAPSGHLEVEQTDNSYTIVSSVKDNDNDIQPAEALCHTFPQDARTWYLCPVLGKICVLFVLLLLRLRFQASAAYLPEPGTV